jgi:hypothetical protein
VTLRKYFSHPSLVMHYFATPSIKLKLGHQIGGALQIANHLDQSLWWANEKHWAAVRSYLLYSFLQVHSSAAHFTGHGIVHNYAEPKPYFPEPNWHILYFFIQFYCAGSHTDHLWRCSNLGPGALWKVECGLRRAGSARYACSVLALPKPAQFTPLYDTNRSVRSEDTRF